MFNICNSVLIYNCKNVKVCANLFEIKSDEHKMDTLYYRVSVKFIIKILNLFIVKNKLPVIPTEIFTNLTTSVLSTH
jgi:hypothetical protein